MWALMTMGLQLAVVSAAVRRKKSISELASVEFSRTRNSFALSGLLKAAGSSGMRPQSPPGGMGGWWAGRDDRGTRAEGTPAEARLKDREAASMAVSKRKRIFF